MMVSVVEHYECVNKSTHRDGAVHEEWSLSTVICTSSSQHPYVTLTLTDVCTARLPLEFNGTMWRVLPRTIASLDVRELTVLVSFRVDTDTRGWLFSEPTS